MHVSYKRGRRAVHSPDLLYDLKLARIRAAYQQMQSAFRSVHVDLEDACRILGGTRLRT
jgi:hypothetical protein